MQTMDLEEILAEQINLEEKSLEVLDDKIEQSQHLAQDEEIQNVNT